MGIYVNSEYIYVSTALDNLCDYVVFTVPFQKFSSYFLCSLKQLENILTR